MKIITKSIVFLALTSLVLSCTEGEDAQNAPVAKTPTLKKEEIKNVNASAEDEAIPKRKKEATGGGGQM
ncbi:hypothetical protein [Flavobacterium sp. FlaQc-48]|uniref:hypothetical protein n=1 Tax=Flavobacterium sp. FlaQc-48 TaxID=3374181 RepID=UPI0037574534